MYQLRMASGSDAEALLEIYNQYIDTSITFEYLLPNIEEFRQRIHRTLTQYPYFVAEKEGIPVGYGYAGRLKERAAYQWNAELSVYIDRKQVGCGLGKQIYRALLSMLKAQNILTVYGCVTLPNPASQGLHQAMGFDLTGVWKKAGYKNETWYDVGWYQLQIGDMHCTPKKVLTPAELDADFIQKVLDGRTEI